MTSTQLPVELARIIRDPATRYPGKWLVFQRVSLHRNLSPDRLVPRSCSCLPHSLASQICLAPALVAFCLVLAEAEAGSAGKQPAEQT
jgi:hypothetical protein